MSTALVVMGVSGSGKTTIARLLADRLGWAFEEADRFHPAHSIRLMESGTPLTDEDRWPWLEAIRDWLSEAGDAVVTCSALKRTYRDLLRGASASVRFVELDVPAAALRDRMTRRTGHFMPVTLLGSQLTDLEPLGTDEDGVRVAASLPPDAVVADALRRLGLEAPAADQPRARPSASSAP